MNLMITGTAGFVGNYVSNYLTKKGYEIYGYDVANKEPLEVECVVNFIEQNNISMIIHIGAMAGLDICKEKPEQAVYYNVYGTSVMLEAARLTGCKFIHTSTWAVEGHLKHPYDITKKMAEKTVDMYRDVYGLKTMTLRLGTLYGWGMKKFGVIWAFLEKSLKNEIITIQGSGKQSRQFLHIEDCARAYEAAIKKFTPGIKCTLVPKEVTTILELAEAVYPDNMKDKVLFTKEREGDEASIFINPDSVKKFIGWQAEISIKEGMNQLKKDIQDDT